MVEQTQTQNVFLLVYSTSYIHNKIETMHRGWNDFEYNRDKIFYPFGMGPINWQHSKLEWTIYIVVTVLLLYSSYRETHCPLHIHLPFLRASEASISARG